MLPKDAKELAEGIMRRRKASLARLASSPTFKAMIRRERTDSEELDVTKAEDLRPLPAANNLRRRGETRRV
jgi:hypothetical protein